MARFQTFDGKADGSKGRERLTALRQELIHQGLDGFIIPRTDDYQNEYVPPSSERLAWLTGFSGSWGMAVVLQTEAAIFVDGRYTVQVREQVDISAFTPQHLIEHPPELWLEERLKKGQKIGFDANLHTPDGIQRLREAITKAGAVLVAVASNPVDAVWHDRPAPPLAQVVLHEQALSGQEAPEKIKRIQEKLANFKADALLVTDPHNLAWIFNIRGGDVSHTPLPLGRAVIPAEGRPVLLLDGRKLSNSVADHLSQMAEIAPPDNLDVTLEKLARAGKTIRVDQATAPVRLTDLIEAAGGTVSRGADPVSLMKAAKNAVELAGTREAHLRDGAAMVHFLHWLDTHAPKGTETEISAAEALEQFRLKTGALVDVSFPSISAAGPNAALPHYRVTHASNRPISEGFYLIDSGGQYRDGTTDITRTIAIGKVTDEMADRYTRVLKGMMAIARAVFPRGTSGAQIDAFARQYLWQIGTDFDHGTGHGVGSYLSVHEGPQRIAKIGTTPLEAGMILSDEPGYYRVGAFGIRIENLIVVEERQIEGAERPMLGFETLTFVPIDTRPIKRELLSRDEINWLNTYHQMVWDKLSSRVEGEAKDWLEQATQPID
jgi:Xaa-Pro aminopeptidase